MQKTGLFKISVTVLSLMMLASCGNNKQAAEQADVMAQNIVGGKNANASYQRVMGVVALMIRSEDDSVGICTGSLIAKRLVLTAAHCLNGASRVKNVVAVFATDISKASRDEMRAAISGVAHENFIEAVVTQQETWNDIAILKLSSDAPANMRLAQLPKSADEIELKAGVKLSQAGYGRAEALHADTSDTSGVLRRVDGIEILRLSSNSNELRLKEDGKGSCRGDSGGPAYARTKRGLVVVGVNSRGTSRTSCIEEGIYTNVIPYLEWIKTTSEKLMAESESSADAPSAPQAAAPAGTRGPAAR